jgi:hypothetical protein
MVCQWFGLKTIETVFFDLASKPVAMVFSDLATKSVATISPGLALKPVVNFLVEPQNQDGGVFSILCLKTDSCSLMIWASKSLRRFLSLVLKTKRGTVCRLRHKTDGRMKMVRDTRRDLVVCFA